MNTAQPYQCEEVRQRLNDYLDQELSPQEMRLTLEHLDVCPDCMARCQQAYQELADLRAAIQDFDVPDGLPEELSRHL